MNTLSLLRWADVRQEWEWVKPKVEEIREHCREDWRSEDVYAACLYNKAQLFIGTGAFERLGFVVLQVVQNDSTLHNELFIWLASGEGVGLQDEFIPEIKRIAKDMQCNRIYFRSRRQGWLKSKIAKLSCMEYDIDIEA